MSHVKDLRRRVRTLAQKGRAVLFPQALLDAATVDALDQARDVWMQTFAPMAQDVADTDVLEVGCGDGFLLAVLLANGGARSAIGVDRPERRQGPGLDALALESVASRLEIHNDLAFLQALDQQSFDLVLCRDVEAVFDVEGVEDGLARLYGLLRPGGEALIVVGCAAPGAKDANGPGYGFLTPSSWAMLAMRAGFEIDAERRQPRSSAGSDFVRFDWNDELSTTSISYRLLRPWEGAEMNKVWSAKEQT